jgi:putative transposase
MARLPRLVLPGHAHWVIQRGHGGRPVFTDDADRTAFLAALREAAPAHGVQVLAWALPGHEVQLLLVPAEATALSAVVQAVGRRFVAGYNRRHGCAGTLWDGRFRAAAVEPGTVLLDVLTAIDGLPLASGQTSLAQRLGGRPDALLTDPPEFWLLGNTPFDREASYRRRVAEGLPAARLAAWRQAALGGWPIGGAAFQAGAADAAQRPAHPRKPGRPRGPAARPVG